MTYTSNYEYPERIRDMKRRDWKQILKEMFHELVPLFLMAFVPWVIVYVILPFFFLKTGILG